MRETKIICKESHQEAKIYLGGKVKCVIKSIQILMGHLLNKAHCVLMNSGDDQQVQTIDMELKVAMVKQVQGYRYSRITQQLIIDL